MLIEKCVTSGLKQDSASCLEEFSLGSTNNRGPALLPLSSLKDVVIQCISVPRRFHVEGCRQFWPNFAFCRYDQYRLEVLLSSQRSVSEFLGVTSLRLIISQI
ncbi:unnamed protein product [Calypogeia fissa]